MKALYEVRLIASCTVAVEASSAEEAEELAVAATETGDYQFLHTLPIHEAVGAIERDRIKRHADRVMS